MGLDSPLPGREFALVFRFHSALVSLCIADTELRPLQKKYFHIECNLFLSSNSRTLTPSPPIVMLKMWWVLCKSYRSLLFECEPLLVFCGYEVQLISVREMSVFFKKARNIQFWPSALLEGRDSRVSYYKFWDVLTNIYILFIWIFWLDQFF